MTISRILSPAQAEVVHNVMRALNNVGMATFKTTLTGGIAVTQNEFGCIAVDAGGPVESYANQAAFATAYALDREGAIQGESAATTA